MGRTVGIQIRVTQIYFHDNLDHEVWRADAK